MPFGPIQFKSWVDRGHNIGVQCLVCFRNHWTGKEDATDPMTAEPCVNCQAIKDNKIRERENEIHRGELRLYENQRQEAMSENRDPNEVKLQCNHPLSQPL